MKVPYNLKFKLRKYIKKDDYIINVSILIRKNSHKPIVIGKSGEKLKKLEVLLEKI